jgi:protocatechuate 3,4-dioxygenase beta subunit
MTAFTMGVQSLQLSSSAAAAQRPDGVTNRLVYTRVMMRGLVLTCALLACRSDTARPVTRSPVSAPVPPGPAEAPREPAARDVSRPIARGVLAGTVRDGSGKPIASARACARSEDDGWGMPVCVATDARGGYRLEVPVGRYVVDAMARGLVPAPYRRGTDASIYVAPDSQQQDLDITLATPGAEVTGIVTDASGAPVSGALVNARTYWSQHPTAFVETDAAGRYSVWMRGDVIVSARTDGYTSTVERGTAPGTIDLRVVAEAVVEGRVIHAPTGAPVAGIRVEATRMGNVSRFVVTDAAGRFRIGQLSYGRHHVIVRDAGLHSEPAPSVVLRAGETTRHEVRVRPAARVTGTIVAGDTGRSCGEGRARLTDEYDIDYSARSDPNGTVVFEALHEGTYQVAVDCANHRRAPSYPPLVVGAGPIEGVQWSVIAGSSIVGRARTARGLPVAGAWIAAVVEAGNPMWASGHATSAVDGTFEVVGLAEGVYALTVYNDVGVIAPTRVVVRGARVQHDLTILFGASIRGTVVDPTGRALPRVEVELVSDEQLLSPLRKTRTLTAPDGSFAFMAYPAGNYRVRAHVPWATRDLPELATRVRLRAATTAQAKLVIAPPSETIVGTVVDARGKPVRDAWISCDRATVTVSRADGSFEVSQVPDEIQSCSATRDGVISAMGSTLPRSPADAPPEPFQLRLPDPATIEGTIVRVDGGPIREVSIEVMDATGPRLERFHSHRFVLRDLVPGTIQLAARVGDATGTVELDVGEGAITRGVSILVK